MYQNLIALIDFYNTKRAIPSGKPTIDRNVISPGADSQRIDLPCRVAHVGDQTYGKFSSDVLGDMILMEYKHFLPNLADHLPPGFSLESNQDFKDFLKSDQKMLYELTDFMMFTLPSPRVSYYENSDFFQIQKAVTSHANDIIEDLGFFPIAMKMGLLNQMEFYSTAILFLGLIFDIIVLLFVVLSVLLIYSLLLISVESKTFEFGVMRMVGLSKSGIISMILIQSLMFVLPSVLISFIACFPTLVYLYSLLFSDDMGIDKTPVPNTSAIIQGLIIGIVIPLLSSIIPIQAALSKNLNESLDIQRSKTKAMYVKILDKKHQNMSSYIVFGVIAVAYGLSIYYFLPLAMLSMNFALILKIFFFILIGMLFGLSLLAFNLQRFLEIILTKVFLFFEKASMKQMVTKNLTAHRMRNKMTSIIYSIALGFIIFLIVSYNL
jgi:hypothetical protein